MSKSSIDLIEILNDNVKPLITTVTNYFAGRIAEDSDITAAVLSLQIALKNWEAIEDEFDKLEEVEPEISIESFKFKRPQEPTAKAKTAAG